MDQSDKIVALLQEIRDNQKIQIEMASKLSATYLKVVIIAFLIFAMVYAPYLVAYISN